MNFEFPFTELPAVMRGPRVERRRVLVGGSACWGTMVEEGAQQGQLRLDDGRVLDPATVQHLPPVSPSKVIAVHMPRSEDETNVELVKQSMLEHGITESCAIDNMHDVKDAFLNEAGFVPHYYVFNADGILESRAAGDAGVASIDAALVKLFPA